MKLKSPELRNNDVKLYELLHPQNKISLIKIIKDIVRLDNSHKKEKTTLKRGKNKNKHE